MAWTPQFANEELARMRAESESRRSGGSIRSRGTEDYSDWPGFDKPASSRKADEREDLNKLLKEIERKIRLGLPVKARDATKLINLGLLELPEEYELEGSEFVRKMTPALRSKAAAGLGWTPTMTPGGGMAFGTGAKGGLTGEEAMSILASQPTGPTAEQTSLVEGARGRIASRMREQDMAAAERANLELSRMRSLGTGERAKKTGETKAERNYRKWAEANPTQAMELQLQQAAEARRATELAQQMSKDEMKSKVRSDINEAIKSGRYSSEVIGKLNELKNRSFDQYADVEAIFAEAEGLIAVGDKKTADQLARKQEEIRMAGEEWDRRRDRVVKDTQDAEKRSAGRSRVATENKNQYALQEDIYEVQDDIAKANARIQGLQELETSLGDDPANAKRLNEVRMAIQITEVLIFGLAGELKSKQSRLATMPGFGGTARAGGGQGQMDRAGFIEAFRQQYGREPSSSEISKAQGRYWF